VWRRVLHLWRHGETKSREPARMRKEGTNSDEIQTIVEEETNNKVHKKGDTQSKVA
jgi:hypothetical protein